MTAATRISVIRADITTLSVDAIVNAANPALSGGGGVDGAIHRAAGPELVAASRRLGPCPPGEARITNGYRLPARYVIHAVGPVWDGGRSGEVACLARCHTRALELAVEHDARTVAFPAISCGVYRFPLHLAAPAALGAVAAFLRETDRISGVVFAMFDSEAEAEFTKALARLDAAGDSLDPVMYVPRMDAFLNRWFRTYAEARAALDAEGGFLFPYARQFFVTQPDAVGELGLDPEDPDWRRIGWDWVRPADRAALERLRLKRTVALD